MSTQEAAQTQIPTREWQDVEVPPAGTYEIDPAHSTVEIIARHMMIAKVRGRFEEFTGHIELAEDPAESTAEVDIQAGSINTAEQQRDEHLRSPDFLDVEQWPSITFRASNPQRIEGSKFRLDGELTIRETTQTIPVEVTLEGVGKDPWGNTRVFFTGSFTIDREDFGITWNQALETGGVLVGKKLTAELEVQAVLQES